MAAVTLKEQAYEKLRHMILSGDIHSNEHLTEKYLVDILQMSRTPIRAALERLSAEGLVSYSPNRGLSLQELSLQRVVDFFDFRMAIEGYIASKLAARIWDEHEIALFRSNLEEQERCVQSRDYVAFTKADSQFHRMLARIYDNQEMHQTMEQLQDKLFQVALKVLRKDNARIQQSFEDHRDIFELILRGDGEAARKRMVEHLEYGARILIL